MLVDVNQQGLLILNSITLVFIIFPWWKYVHLEDYLAVIKMLDYWYVAVHKAVCHRKRRWNITLCLWG